MTDDATKQQWISAAQGWTRWAEKATVHLEPATDTMLDLAGVSSGQRVLDVGCGSGEQTVIAARRVGETGHVLAFDIAAPMTAACEAKVLAAGLHNVSTCVSSAEMLDAGAGPFDAAISRLVLMLVPDPVSTARAVLALLRPGAAFSALVFADASRNPFEAVPLSILARHGGKTLSADKPGIFALADPARLVDVLEQAGFVDVSLTTIATVHSMDSAAEATTMIREAYAFLVAQVADLSQAAKDAAWAEVQNALSRYEGPDGLKAPGEMLLVVGRKPGH